MAGLQVSVRGDMNPIFKDLAIVQNRIMPLATSSAMNKSMAKGRTASTRQIAKMKGIKVSLVKKLVVFKGRLKAKPRRLNAATIAHFEPIKASMLKASERKKISAMPGNFQATMPSGKRLIMMRKLRASTSSGRDRKGRLKKNRLPIQEAGVPWSEFEKKVWLETQGRVTAASFVEIFNREMNFRLRRRLG